MLARRPVPKTPNPHALALHACVQEAVAEGAGLVRRWVKGLQAELALQESAARSSRDKTALAEAIKTMISHQAGVESVFVAHWEQAIREALQGVAVGQGVVARRALSQLRFDDLELMDDSQVQAAVESARVLQAVQASSEIAMRDLTARVCRAQGLVAVKEDQNPFRPEVVVQALSRTLERLCGTASVRSLWLQHGSLTLAAELELLYRHLARLLDLQGVRPAEYAPASEVLSAGAGPQALPNRFGGWGGGAESGRANAQHAAHGSVAPQGFYADRHEPMRVAPLTQPDQPTDFQPSSLFTLSDLHQLLLSSAPELATGDHPQPAALQGPQGVGSGSDQGAHREGGQAAPPDGGEPALAGAGASGSPLTPYLGPDRRRRQRNLTTSADVPVVSGAVDAAQLVLLGQEVVGMMLDGIASDDRLLPPVRTELRRLRPLFLRVVQEDPRFFADRRNPARCLLDEVTQQGMSFSSEDSGGFAVFLTALEQVVGGLLQADSPAAELLERAMLALQATAVSQHSANDGQNQARAVAALLKAEQRFLLAEQVAQEIRSLKEYRVAPPLLRQFLSGPWSQVVAFARLEPSSDSDREGQMPAEVRYTELISDLTWSCLPEVAGNNRSRLVRVIPLLLRNLREGLQSIGYPQERANDFFAKLMQLQESALKAVGPSPDSRVRGTPTRSPPQPWVSPQERRDTGFMNMPEDDAEEGVQHTDFAETHPMSDANWHISMPVAPPDGPDLVLGSWVELLQPSGAWQRARLRWASPHGTMYLFSISGQPSVSMTRHHFNALLQRQQARCVAVQSMVDDALDSVMNTAVRNSMVRSGTAPDKQ